MNYPFNTLSISLTHIHNLIRKGELSVDDLLEVGETLHRMRAPAMQQSFTDMVKVEEQINNSLQTLSEYMVNDNHVEQTNKIWGHVTDIVLKPLYYKQPFDVVCQKAIDHGLDFHIFRDLDIHEFDHFTMIQIGDVIYYVDNHEIKKEIAAAKNDIEYAHNFIKYVKQLEGKKK